MEDRGNAVWAALGGLVLQIVAGIVLLLIGGWSSSSSCLSLGFFTLMSSPVWGVAFLHTRQLRLTDEEGRELAETEKRGAMFDEQDLGTLSAKSGLRNIELYLLPSVTVLLSLLLTAVTFYLFAIWRQEPSRAISNHFMPSAIVFGFGAFLLFYGMYVKGMTSLEGWRLLRAASSPMLFSAFASLVIAATVILSYLGMPRAEHILARIIAIMAGLTGLDLLLSMIGGLFVPRTPGTVRQPPYHSRVLDMLTSPGDILRTVADIVDYQFGFSVSETWFYTFVEKAIIPLLLFWAITLYAFTCIVVVGPDEEAIKERYGKPFEGTLEPGLHFKMPWPIDKVYTYPARAVHTLTIGYEEEMEGQSAILWTEKHYKEEDMFLVATRGDAGDEGKFVPVSFVAATTTIHYRISDLHKYIYQKSNPDAYIKDIATREIVQFLGGIDIMDLLKEKRLPLANDLRGRIEKVLADANVGVEVLYLGFESAHPPVEVGEAYESVIKALEEKHVAILKAETYKSRVLHEANGEASVIKEEANAYKFKRAVLSQADADSYELRMKAFNVSPRVFTARKRLTALQEGTQDIRKYIIPPSSEVSTRIWLNIEDKLRFDIEDLNLGEELGGE